MTKYLVKKLRSKNLIGNKKDWRADNGPLTQRVRLYQKRTAARAVDRAIAEAGVPVLAIKEVKNAYITNKEEMVRYDFIRRKRRRV